MASLGNEASKLSSAVADTLRSIAKSPVGAWKQAFAKAAPEVEAAATSSAGRSVASSLGHGIARTVTFPFRVVGGAIGGMMGASARGALHIIEQPFAYSLKAVRGGVNLVGGAYRKAPLIMFPATAIAAGGYVVHKVKQSARARAEDEYAMAAALQEQAMRAEQAGAGASAQATTTVTQPAAPAPAAEDKVTAADMELLNARLKESGKTSQVEALNAARSQGTSVANAAAL